MPTLETLAPEVEEDDHRGQASLVVSATCLRLPPVPTEETREEVQDEVKGTLHHRLWFCPRLEEARTRAVDPDIVEEARRADPADLFFTRGLLPRDCLPVVPPPHLHEIWRYAYGGGQQDITGEIYTDGAGRTHIGWPEAARAGWGIALMSGTQLRGLAFGPLP
eukprot:2507058-Pyramimonas_sp.AAC.1